MKELDQESATAIRANRMANRGYAPRNSPTQNNTFAKIEKQTGAVSDQVLTFPETLGSTDQGHFIMFFINEQKNANVEFGSSKKITRQVYPDDFATEPYTLPVRGSVSESKQNEINQQMGQTTNSVKRAPTTRLTKSIAMYMPQSVQVTYGAQYQDTQIGAVTESALNTFNEFVSGRLSGGLEELKKVGADTADQLQLFLLGAVGIIPGLGGVREVSEMKSGNVIADRLELAFKGINKRNFQYTFKMTPKDRREVEMIRKIIFAFKSNMMPEFIGGNRGGRRLLVPNTFDIAYMYTGNQNLHLHNISTCVLENMNVTYGGDRYRTFEADGEGAQPVETTMTLNFKEMELITRERIFEGY